MAAWRFDLNEDTYNCLVVAYSEKGRCYHTQEHLEACLRNLDRCLAQTEHPYEVELALWFHDAIYQPLSSRSEEKSADWAASFLSLNGASSESIARVRRLIVVTKHDTPAQTSDESIVVDIDLSVLGADSATYEAFENAVRKEYRLVPWFVYRKKRVDLLRRFLERPRIYQNEPFSSTLEAQARVNLSHAVSRLSGRA